MNRTKLIFVVLVLLLLTGCSPRVVISENWNWRPATIAVIFTNPVVANTDDIEDDLPEYVNSFPVWMSAELKRNIEAKAEDFNDHSRMHVSVVAYPTLGNLQHDDSSARLNASFLLVFSGKVSPPHYELQHLA